MATSSAAGKTVIVTGAAGGLGKVIATAFLEAGANVAICDVNDARLKETAAGWAKYGESKFIVSQANITDETSVNAFFTSVVTKFGRVDMLINNAGVMDHFDGAATMPLDIWNRVISVNLTGPFLCTKAAVNQFLAQSPVGGTIINICSIASVRGLASGAAYTASKHGLLGLSKNTAGFYGPKGINSIAFLMGGMPNTNIADAFATGINQENMMLTNSMNPGFVPGETNINLDDVAKYCIFYADPSMAANMNGADIKFSKNWPAA